MFRFIAAAVVALIGAGGVWVTQKFHYKSLTKRQLAKMVYELNKQLVANHNSGSRDIFMKDLREKAQKMINRARLEGLL